MFGSGPVHLKLPLHFINNTVRGLTDAACTQTHPSVAGILKARSLNGTGCTRIPPGKIITNVTSSIGGNFENPWPVYTVKTLDSYPSFRE